MSDSNLVAIAEIVRPRGLKGEMVANLLTDFHDRFENLERVIITQPSIENGEYRLSGFRFQKNRILIRLEEIDSIEDAESMRGALICVSEEDAIELEEDKFYDWKLQGCKVFDTDGKPIGEVQEILRAGENENLVVIGKDKEYLIPFVKAICVLVDIEKKRIEIDPPEGLLDF